MKTLVYREVSFGLRFCGTMVAVLLLTTASVFAVRYSQAGSRVEGTRELIEKIRQYPNDGGLVIRLKESALTEKDPKLQQQGLAVFALNAMLRDHTALGVKARNFLLEKYPESLYSQALNMKYIGCICPVCEGKGGFWKDCPVCHGDGICRMCEGSGTVTTQLSEGEEMSCPRCGGTGECPVCNGTARSRRDCHKCYGRGFLLGKAALKNVYSAVLAGNPQSVLPKKEDHPLEELEDELDDAQERGWVKPEEPKNRENEKDVLEDF